MGPRLGRVEYVGADPTSVGVDPVSMGPRLGRVEYVIGVSMLTLDFIRQLQWGHA